MNWKTLTTFGAAALCATSLFAAYTNVEWTGGGDGTRWGDANNWNPTTVPSGGYDSKAKTGYIAKFPDGTGILTVDLDATTYTIADIYFGNTGLLTLQNGTISKGNSQSQAFASNAQVLIDGATCSFGSICFGSATDVNVTVRNGGKLNNTTGRVSYGANSARVTVRVEGTGSSSDFRSNTAQGPGIAGSDHRWEVVDGGVMSNGSNQSIFSDETRFGQVRPTIYLSNGTFSASSIFYFGTLDSADTPTIEIDGTNSQFQAKGGITLGTAANMTGKALVKITVPGKDGFKRIPLDADYKSKVMTLGLNAKFVIDATAVELEEGASVTMALAKGRTLTIDDAVIPASTIAVQDGYVGTLYVESNTVYLKVENSGGKQVVEVPEIESKVYTGELQTADVPEDEGYVVTANEGGTDVGEYPVVLTTNAGYVWSGTTEAETATNLTFVIAKADNEWTTPPALSKTVWKVGEEAATTNNYATKFGDTFEVVYDGDAELTAMPEEIGKHTVAITAVATTNWNALTATLAYYVTREDGTIPDVSPVTYTWTNAADGVWAEAGNWSASAEVCNGFPGDTKYATAVFGPLEGVDSLTVTPGELEEVKTYKLEFQSGMPTNIVFDMQGKSFETGVDYIDYGTYHHFLADTAYTFKNGTFAMKQDQAKHASYMMHAGTVLNLTDGADVKWSTVPLGDGAYRVNVTGGSKWYANATPTYGTYAMSGASVVVSGEGSSYDDAASGKVTRRNCRYEARDGGSFSIYDFDDTFPGSSFLVEGSNSVMKLPATYNTAVTYANLTITARDGGTLEFGARSNSYATWDTGFGGDNSGLVLTVDDATVRTTSNVKQAFRFGTKVSEVAPQFIVKGAAPHVRFKCPATFGSDSFGTNSLGEVSAPVLAFEPPAGGWAEAPIVGVANGKDDKVTTSITLASNLVIRASIADFKGKVDLVKVPKGYTLTADVEQLAANTVFEGVKRGEAKYEIVTTEEETILRATWKPAGGCAFFVK